jgi:hypothetical protein
VLCFRLLLHPRRFPNTRVEGKSLCKPSKRQNVGGSRGKFDRVAFARRTVFQSATINDFGEHWINSREMEHFREGKIAFTTFMIWDPFVLAALIDFQTFKFKI